jgi:hypothetical protein
MRSSINLAFDGGNYFNVKKQINQADLKVILDASEKQGSFKAPKDTLKVQNYLLGLKDLKEAYYDQNLVSVGVRRF